MHDVVTIIVPGILALAGVLTAALLAHGRWRRERASANSDAYHNARREAYKVLWEKLEAINLSLREQRGRNPSLFAALKDVNTFFIRHSAYLEDEDQKLVNRYVEALHRWRSAIFTSGDEDVVSAFMKTWSTFPSSLDKEIGLVSRSVADLRGQVLARVRSQMQE